MNPALSTRNTGGNAYRSETGSCRIIYASVVILAAFLMLPNASLSDVFTDNPPLWERLLWGGKIPGPDSEPADSDRPEAHADTPAQVEEAAESGTSSAGTANPSETPVKPFPLGVGQKTSLTPAGPILPKESQIQPRSSPVSLPFRNLRLKRIPPLYAEPKLDGEGIWEHENMPHDKRGWPVMYSTSYRPSAEYPNAIVHMLLFDMRRLEMRLYIGSAEPEAPEGASQIEEENKARLVAITNAMWKQRHARGAGAIHRGAVLHEMQRGMATLVNYADDSVDILEWIEGIPEDWVRDARQLRHLIVKNGKVVRTVIKRGTEVDSEIGLGFLLAEDSTTSYSPWGPYYGGYSSTEWFIATRSAFGIRPDGNLVFAIGHHISTKDLAKALVLAGCVRAIHGDANPHNVVGNLYYSDDRGTIVKKAKLSPDQKDYTLRRYVDSSYTSDFYAFFLKEGRREVSP